MKGADLVHCTYSKFCSWPCLWHVTDQSFSQKGCPSNKTTVTAKTEIKVWSWTTDGAWDQDGLTDLQFNVILTSFNHSFIHSFIHQWLYSSLLGPGLFFSSVILSLTSTLHNKPWRWKQYVPSNLQYPPARPELDDFNLNKHHRENVTAYTRKCH
jgi:hypothetical protein